MFWANDDTSGFQPNVGAMGAIMAFGGCVCFGVDVDGVVGARLHARFAANADAVVEFDNAIITLVHRFCGADADAWRIGAMVAACDLKMTAGVWVAACFYVFDPGAVDAERDFVFAFAGGGAGVAADAFTVVDHKAVIFDGCQGLDVNRYHWRILGYLVS